MKWIAAATGVLSVAMLVLNHNAEKVPEPPETVEIKPERLQKDLKETGKEVKEAVEKVMPGVQANEDGLGLSE